MPSDTFDAGSALHPRMIAGRAAAAGRRGPGRIGRPLRGSAGRAERCIQHEAGDSSHDR